MAHRSGPGECRLRVCGQAGFLETEHVPWRRYIFSGQDGSEKKGVIRSGSEAVGQESEPAEEKIGSVGHQQPGIHSEAK